MSTTLPPPGRPWTCAPYAQALHSRRGPLFLRRSDGWLLPLDVERWCASPDAADLSALRRCEGPVLDIGCGPGRMVAALASRGQRALGIDVSEAAVDRAVETGGAALLRSVFDPLPAEGHWGTALLVDGNIGIGGDVRSLLVRTGKLLAPDGLLIAETSPLDVDERCLVHIDSGRPRAESSPDALFPWARVGTAALLRHARPLGWYPDDQWVAGGRPFVVLRRRRRARSSADAADAPNSAAVRSSQRPRNTSAGRPVAGP